MRKEGEKIITIWIEQYKLKYLIPDSRAKD